MIVIAVLYIYCFFIGVSEEVVMETEETVMQENPPVERIMYLSDGNVIVMDADAEQTGYQEEIIDCNVSEEIITQQWDENCPEEISNNFCFSFNAQ